MVGAPSFDRSEAEALNEIKVAVGLHVTLTAPFRPLSENFRPLQHDAFAPMRAMLHAAVLRRLDTAALEREVRAQFHDFARQFGKPPDFVDGHQHVQLFPQIRNVVLRVMQEMAPNAWIRQCGRIIPRRQRIHDRKGLLLDILSVRFRRRARRMGIKMNPAFAGTYDFTPDAQFSRLFPTFLQNLPAGGVVMCHPGFVDAELIGLDTLTELREREFEYLSGPKFPQDLERAGVTLARA